MLNFNLKQHLNNIQKEYSRIDTIEEKCEGYANALANTPEIVVLESLLNDFKPFDYLPLVATMIKESSDIAMANHNKYLVESTIAQLTGVDDPVYYAIKNKLVAIVEKTEDQIAESLVSSFGEYNFIPQVNNLRNAVSYHSKGYKPDSEVKFQSVYSPVMIWESIAEGTENKSQLLFNLDGKYYYFNKDENSITECFDRINDNYKSRVDLFNQCIVNEDVITFYGKNGKTFKIESVDSIDEAVDPNSEHAVYLKGGSIGGKKGEYHPKHGSVIKKGTKDECKSYAKDSNSRLSKGEKSYYKMKYHVKPYKEFKGGKVDEFVFKINDKIVNESELPTQIPFALGLNENHLSAGLIDLYNIASSILKLDDIVRKVNSPVNENLSFNIFKLGSDVYLNRVDNYNRINNLQKLDVNEAVETIKSEFNYDISESVKEIAEEKQELINENFDKKEELVEKLNFLNEQKSLLVNSGINESVQINEAIALLDSEIESANKQINFIKLETPEVFESKINEAVRAKVWVLGERGNPQLGTYWVKKGQWSKTELKERRKSAKTGYGSMDYHSFNTEQEYNDKIKELQEKGVRIR